MAARFRRGRCWRTRSLPEGRWHVRGGQADHAEDVGEDLVAEQAALVRWIEIGDQEPTVGLDEGLRFGLPGDGSGHLGLSARVVRGPRLEGPHQVPDRVEELLGLVPSLGQDQDLGRCAGMAGVEQPAEDDAVGLPADVLAAPLPGHDDQRVDPAELRIEGLGQQGCPGGPIVVGLIPDPPHKRVVRSCRPGHVDAVDPRMIGQVLAYLRAPVNEPQPARGGEVGEDPFQERPQVGVDRVQLHRHRAPPLEQQRQGVHARQAGTFPAARSSATPAVWAPPSRYPDPASARA